MFVNLSEFRFRKETELVGVNCQNCMRNSEVGIIFHSQNRMICHSENGVLHHSPPKLEWMRHDNTFRFRNDLIPESKSSETGMKKRWQIIPFSEFRKVYKHISILLPFLECGIPKMAFPDMKKDHSTFDIFSC